MYLTLVCKVNAMVWSDAVDGDPGTAWRYNPTSWKANPGNVGLSLPKYTRALTMLALNPHLKFIALIRNPTAR